MQITKQRQIAEASTCVWIALVERSSCCMIAKWGISECLKAKKDRNVRN